MAQDSVPRFELLDEDQLRDLIHAADSKNTKNSVKFAVNVFEEYLHETRPNTNLHSVNELPNSELDNVLQRFYAGARQKNCDFFFGI